MITERLMRLGEWSLTFTDPSLYDDVDYFDHVVIVPGRLDHAGAFDDAGILAAASYAGVIRSKLRTASSRSETDDRLILSGAGLAFWLGDEDGKGHVIEVARDYSAATFANVLNAAGSPYGLLRDDAGAQTSIVAGTLFSVAGTYTGRHVYQSQRAAIGYVLDTFGAEYRINPDFTFDAGVEADLFVTSPTAVIARRAADGRDPGFDGVPLASFESDLDVNDYTTRVVVLAEGSGEAIATGSADAGAVPYLDPFGNPVSMTRLVSESETSTGNADTRAQLHLNRFSGLRKALTVSLDRFAVDGIWSVGDTVFVYDPTVDQLVDTANEVYFRGEVIWPVAIRVLGHTWPVTRDMTVFVRHGDGTYIDVTESVLFETGNPTIEIGANPRSTTSGDPTVVTGRVNPGTGSDDATVPAVPAHTNTPWSTSSYVDGEGVTRARILVQWATPLNTDASTIVDGSHFDIRWRRSGETAYQTSSVGWGTTSFLLQDLSPGVVYEVSVQAVDIHGNQSGYGADEVVTASPDTVPPSTPAAATVAGNPLRVQVSHDLGKSTGGTFNLEADLNHLNVYIDTTAGFTPSPANHAGQIDVTAAHLALGISAIGSFDVLDTTPRFVKVTAVDHAGNESPASAAASVTAKLIETAFIEDLAVTDAKIATLTASKISAGTISTGEITIASTLTMGSGGIIRTAASGKRVQLSTATFQGLEFYSGNGSETAPGLIGFDAFDRLTLREHQIGTQELGALWWDAGTGFYLRSGERGTLSFYDYWFLRGADDFPARLMLQASAAGRIRVEDLSAVRQSLDLDVNQARLVNGSAGTPSLAFISDTDLGLFRAAADHMAFVSGGAEVFRVAPAQLRAEDGAAGTPVISFTADTNTGLFRVTTDVLGFSTGGTEKLRIGTAIQTSANIQPLVAGTNAVGTGAAPFGSGYFDDLRSPGHGTTTDAANANINSTTGQIRRSTSSRRFKRSIRPLTDPTLILGLHPVAYRSRIDDDDDRRRFGFIAEDVAETVPELVTTDSDGRPIGVEYGHMTAPIVAWILDADRRLAALEAGR